MSAIKIGQILWVKVDWLWNTEAYDLQTNSNNNIKNIIWPKEKTPAEVRSRSGVFAVWTYATSRALTKPVHAGARLRLQVLHRNATRQAGHRVLKRTASFLVAAEGYRGPIHRSSGKGGKRDGRTDERQARWFKARGVLGLRGKIINCVLGKIIIIIRIFWQDRQRRCGVRAAALNQNTVGRWVGFKFVNKPDYVL